MNSITKFLCKKCMTLIIMQAVFFFGKEETVAYL